MEVPVDAPSSCPGVNSDQAGKSDGCSGCPNQSLCASGEAKKPLQERQPELVAKIKMRMNKVKNRIIVLSGKGGVGKSSVSVCIARALSQKTVNNNLLNVGILDLDICGPSLPCMFDCMDEKVHESATGWSPVYVTPNLNLMSAGLMLDNPDQCLVWRGPKKDNLIKRLLQDVSWTDDNGCLDYLIIDTPPGTSDEILSIVNYLKAADCLDMAIVVTNPQEVALSDVRKAMDFCKKVGLPILGVVENMSGFLCRSCDKTSDIFPNHGGGAKQLCNDTIPLIAKLPLDPRLTRYLDEGRCPFNRDEDDADESYRLDDLSPVIQEYKRLVDTILARSFSTS